MGGKWQQCVGFNGRPLSKAKQSGAYKATITVKNIYLAADAPERQPAEWTCRPNEHCKFAMLDVCSFVPTVLQTTALEYAVLHAQLGCLPAVSDPCETWHQRSGRRERVLRSAAAGCARSTLERDWQADQDEHVMSQGRPSNPTALPDSATCAVQLQPQDPQAPMQGQQGP